MAKVVFIFDTILVCTYLLLMVVLILFLQYKQRKDQLLLECLDRVFTQTKYEMIVFSFYLVITSIQMVTKRFVEYQLYNYQLFVLSTTILSYLVGLLYGLVFVSPKRITIQQEKKEIELLSAKQETDLDSDLDQLGDDVSFD